MVCPRRSAPVVNWGVIGAEADELAYHHMYYNEFPGLNNQSIEILTSLYASRFALYRSHEIDLQVPKIVPF